MTPSPTTGKRPEIQALRAVAVLGVLAFHLWPNRLTGGFVGVDIFFVVSGFLITDHLVREYTRERRVRLASFWSRRARRLLPASLLVLAATALAVFTLVPISRWQQFGSEIVASALYVQNWALAAQSVDYMARGNLASPTQHFWTLSVEEQFYVVWPLALLLGAWIATRLHRRALAGAAFAFGALTCASFVYSIVLTATIPTVAYFSTFTRAWEFGAGALLALALRVRPVPFSPFVSSILSWGGLGFILAAMVWFNASTPFPSWTALLPVTGCVAVIAAGSPSPRWSPSRLAALRPVQFIGDVSYGVYLWHWPLIVLLPYATGHKPTTLELVAIGVVSLILGWLSKRFVEDPVRQASFLVKARPRRTLVGTAGAMALALAAAAPLALSTVPPAPSAPDTATPCWGANAMDNSECGEPDAVPMHAPFESFATDLPPRVVLDCERSVEAQTFQRCDRAEATTPVKLALLGDSHATRLADVLRATGEVRGWGVSTFLVSGCPLVSAAPLGSAWGFDPAGASLCPTVTRAVLDAVESDPTITHVVVTNRTRLYVSPNPADHPLSADSVRATIDELTKAGKQVIVLIDPPETHAVPERYATSAIDCLLARSGDRCELARQDTVFDDPMRAAAEGSSAKVIDLIDSFCTADRCPWRIGGLVVYTDDNHLSRSFAASLAPALSRALERAGVGASD